MKFNFLKGFSLIELMVAISIVTLMMSVVLYNYSTFNDKMGLSAAAQELAIGIRQAQIYGISGKELVDSMGNSSYDIPYGVFVHTQWTEHSKNYYFFRDKNKNNFVSAFTGVCDEIYNECSKENSLGNGVTILCIGDSTGCPKHFNYAGSDITTTQAHITFKRPNSDANIYLTDSFFGFPIFSAANYYLADEIFIRLISPKGNTADVHVKNTGLVYVQ